MVSWALNRGLEETSLFGTEQLIDIKYDKGPPLDPDSLGSNHTENWPEIKQYKGLLWWDRVVLRYCTSLKVKYDRGSPVGVTD